VPQYEYFCHNCKKAFSNILEQAEHQESVACPHCGNRKLEQQVPPFYAVTSKKSRSQNDDSREMVNLSASEEDDRARVLSDWEGEGGAPGSEQRSGYPAR
jgi:putative FmdB family regulatory protein